MTTSKVAGTPMTAAAHAPDRCMDRDQRLAAVKFVGLSQPAYAPEPEPPHQNLFSRVIGLLTVARR